MHKYQHVNTNTEVSDSAYTIQANIIKKKVCSKVCISHNKAQS